MSTTLLFVACFVSGIAIHRKHQDDPSLNAFADAAIELVAFPLRFMKGLGAKKEAAPEDSANSLRIAK